MPLSNSTVSRRIDDMAEDVVVQNTDSLRASPWHAIQLDESTDISLCSKFIVWARYDKGDEMVAEPLLCKPLETTTKGEDVFRMMESFYESHNLNFQKLIASTTDGAPAMLGTNSGFNARLAQVAPNSTTIHCMIHREALASRTLPDSLNSILKITIKMVNHIKSSALNTRIFRQLCSEMDAAHLNLLYYTQVRWLSRGNVILRVFELREELKAYFRSHKKDEFVDNLESPEWLVRLCYLSDIFQRLNELNRSLQGSNVDLMVAHDKIKAFLAFIKLLLDKVRSHRFTLLERVSEYLTNQEGGDTINRMELTDDITEHLKSLLAHMELYFPDMDTQQFKVARNPFTANTDDAGDDDFEQLELVQLKEDTGARTMFDNISNLANFWINVMPTYPLLSAKSLKLLIPFSTTYLCEQSFSSMVVIKTKQRNRLDLESDMILALTKVEPRIEKLMKDKQAHPSH